MVPEQDRGAAWDTVTYGVTHAAFRSALAAIPAVLIRGESAALRAQGSIERLSPITLEVPSRTSTAAVPRIAATVAYGGCYAWTYDVSSEDVGVVDALGKLSTN